MFITRSPQARKERDWLGKTPLAYAAWQGRAEVPGFSCNCSGFIRFCLIRLFGGVLKGFVRI